MTIRDGLLDVVGFELKLKLNSPFCSLGPFFIGKLIDRRTPENRGGFVSKMYMDIYVTFNTLGHHVKIMHMDIYVTFYTLGHSGIVRLFS